jgi:glycosyltransferase EpsD
MKKKVLFTASVSRHIKAFHLPCLKWFQEQGFETHVACRSAYDLPFVDKHWEIPFERAPFSKENFSAYKRLKVAIEEGNFSLIHCHTPAASVLTRLASKASRRNGTKLIYTAHGFHFFTGAPWLNWMLYYPIELWLSNMTDAIVCINHEDFNRIKRKGSKTCEYHLIPGVGTDKNRFFNVEKSEKETIRQKNNIDLNDFIVVYCAEFSDRKNHQFIIKAVRDNIQRLDNNIKFLFAGKGETEEHLKDLVRKYKLEDKFHFLGFRSDIDQVYKMADIGISSSKQEGLGLNLVEEMMCGLPVIATLIRGHNEIIDDQQNGFLFTQGNASQFVDLIQLLKNDKTLYQNFSEKAMIKARKFELNNALETMTNIYRQYI